MGYSTAIGLDVHARSVRACALDCATGTLTERTFKNEPEAIARWALGFGAGVGMVYESGCTGFALCRALNAYEGLGCMVGAVSKMIKPTAERKRKNDRRDAIFLARLLASGNICPVYVPTERMEAYRDLSRQRHIRASERIACALRIKSLLLRHGICWNERTASGRPKKGFGGKEFSQWLNAIRLEPTCEQEVLEGYLEGYKRAERELKEADSRIERHIEDEGVKEMVAALSLFKGVKETCAFAIMAEVSDFRRFRSASAFASWLGIVPAEYSSGQREVKGDITKCGISYLRSLICEASWSYSRANLKAKPVPIGLAPSVKQVELAHRALVRLRDHRRYLLEKGKKPALANIATARELACFIWDMGILTQEGSH
jgi:transposase